MHFRRWGVVACAAIKNGPQAAQNIREVDGAGLPLRMPCPTDSATAMHEAGWAHEAPSAVTTRPGDEAVRAKVRVAAATVAMTLFASGAIDARTTAEVVVDGESLKGFVETAKA